MVLMYSSMNWSNNMPRFLTKVNEVDPFDSRIHIRGGANGRQLYIDGRGNGYLSGNQARLEMKSNAYALMLEFSFQWNSTLTSLSTRLRERHDHPDPTTNRFGGYGVVFTSNSLAFFRENYHDTYTNLNPATAALGYSFATGKFYHVRVWLYDNAAHTQTTLKCAIDEGDGYELKGTAVDASPTASMLDSSVYVGDSNTWLKVNGTSPRDVLIRDIRVIDLKVNYTET